MTAYEQIATLTARLERENAYLQEEIHHEHDFAQMVGGSEALLAVLRRVDKVAPTDATSLVTGETGTGKDALNKRRGKRSQVEEPLEGHLPQYTADGHREGDRSFLLADWSQMPDEVLLSREGRGIVRAAVECLPAHYRVVLVLRDVEEFSSEEVAEIVGDSVASVKSRRPPGADRPGVRQTAFQRRMQWFIDNRPDLREHVQLVTRPDGAIRRMLSIVSRDKLPRVLRFMLDEREFLSPHGIRAVSRHHVEQPHEFSLGEAEHRVHYEPAESTSGLFGGNSNWRGPIWYPMNYLLIESLQKFHHFYGDALTVPCPTGSERRLHRGDVAADLSRRLARIFLRGADGRRPVYGDAEKFQTDPHWRDLLLFYEYFHGDNGAGLGASHQTGWTALVAKLLQQSGE